MKKRKIILGSLLFLIVLGGLLIITRPFVLKAFKVNQEKVTEEKEEENPAFNKGKALLGMNVLIEGEGLNFKEDQNILMIMAGGEYELVGNLTNGQIIVDTEEAVNLILEGVNITNNGAIPIEVKRNSPVTITLLASSYNTLVTASNCNIQAADLLIEGNGTLTLINQNGQGISANAVTINGGYIFAQAQQQAIMATLTINGGNLLLLGNGLHENLNPASLQKIMQVQVNEVLMPEDNLKLVDENNNAYISSKVLEEVNTLLISGPFLGEGNYAILKNEARIMVNNTDIFPLTGTMLLFTAIAKDK